ncbi:PCMD domain-containing protein [Dyadobacter jiangsuensis]|uniref:Putative glycosyl hydrolase or carbohydrate binding protein n=1 Tax=Dyadobacter jiangsuensis TaxID=1591085 RepID=A0A2P8FQ35_9BACT|nr:PCMD domain-containing protein [Dyadobacter jiangsuensis]PSL23838.1 putative glycosyl hydrolase or carbohydrate binding protein [Dyadobacter jiangsuensis]
MKNTIAAATLLLIFWLAGCIRPEAENMEADILEVKLPDSILIAPPVLSNTTVRAFVKYEKMNIKAFALEFVLTPGATISPQSGVAQDFSSPVTYTVRSADGNWTKQYRVSLLQNTVSGTFFFENWALTPEANYGTPYEIEFGEQQNVWASGNSGFSLVTPEKAPEAYPTRQFTEAIEGKYSALLETKSTGTLGAMFNMPIAAGNLFLGSFDGSKSFTAPLEATVFGIPFNKKPVRFTGQYKYVSGGPVKDKNQQPVSPERLDECDIYAVIFKGSAGQPYLNGTNVLTDPSVVAVAQLANGRSTAGSGFVAFDIPFQYRAEIDPTDLAAYAYKLTVVFSSSKNGAVFEGAVGSKLLVDNVKILTE